jgi:hypothetical protein
MRLSLIACDVFEREVRSVIGRSHNAVDVEFLNRAPHHLTDREMVRYLQLAVDRAAQKNYHAVLLLAGSCKHGFTGLEARGVPLVLPRAKDCISLLLEHTPPGAHRARDGSTASATRSGVTLRQGILTLAAPGVDPGGASPKVPAGGLNAALGWRRTPFAKRPLNTQAKKVTAGSTVLDMLINGYWNYAEFVVVAPGWRVVVNHDKGLISTEEVLP